MTKHFFAALAVLLCVASCTKQSQNEKIPRSSQETVQQDGATQHTGLKGQNQIEPGVDRYRLVVKFKADQLLDISKNKPVFANQEASRTAASFGNRAGGIGSFTYEQVFSFSAQEKAVMAKGITPLAGEEAFNRFAFKGMVYVNEAVKMTPEEVLALANDFEKLDIVEYASMEPLIPPPPPATPDLTSWQTYKTDVVPGVANARGINAEYAWSIGVTGAGIRIADIEWGYNKNHEDLVTTTCFEVLPPPDNQYKDHGTAVAGIMMAKNNGFGMTGMVYGADACYVVSERVRGRAGGIAEGLKYLRRGDVFLYEMQTGGQNGNYVPADYTQSVWDITKSATDAGILVVATAGNGNENLDGAFYASYRARGDNGVIMVGAGTRSGRNKASFSTYGSNVHVQGWGDWSVASAGYTSLYNGGANAGYTKDFSGTSSAAPIVTSAVVAVQSYYKARTGTVMAPRTMRTLLINTGIPQGTGGHIGPLPNIKAAIQSLN